MEHLKIYDLGKPVLTGTRLRAVMLYSALVQKKETEVFVHKDVLPDFLVLCQTHRMRVYAGAFEKNLGQTFRVV